MHKLLLVIFVVLSSITENYCQNIFSIFEQLDWQITKTSDRKDDSEREYHTFSNASYDIASGAYIKYVKKIPLPSYGNIKVNLIPKSIAPLEGERPKMLNNQSIKVTSDIVEENGKFYAFVSFTPIIFKSGNYNIINQFQLNIQFTPRTRNNYRGPQYKNQSILKDGDIYKIGVEESGIYKLDYNFLTSELGIPTNQISSDKIKIFGNRGGLLPEPISTSRLDDLEEIPYLLIGGEDNIFNNDDFIIFYGEGADTYKVIEGEKIYEKNIFSSSNYFFLKIDDTSRKIINTASEGIPQSSSINSYFHYQRYEIDKTNLLGAFGSAQGSGKTWFGDVFSITRTRNYTDEFDFEGITPGSTLIAEIKFAGRSPSSHNVNLNLGNTVFSEPIAGVNTTNIEARYAREVFIEAQILSDGSPSSIVIEYPSNGDNEGWLDYIELQMDKEIKYAGNPIWILNPISSNNDNNSYSVNDIEDAIVWDITDPLNIEKIATSSSQNSLTYHVKNEKELREYILFSPQDISLKPIPLGKIANQDLHSLDEAELVIIYHSLFKEAADRLRDYRIDKGINAISVDVDLLFNEFSSGKRDPVAIRDFSRMIYERSSEYKYLLLFGDASYDYMNLVSGLPDNNFVPAYETNESLHPIEAFPSDDFYALLSDFEGDNLRGQLEIAVGRIPAKTLEEASIVVDKIIRYETDANTYGDWRLRIGFTADDEDSNTHLNQAERIANNTETKFGLFNQQKVYFDSYQQESTPGGARYPDASKALNDNIFKVQLVLNYLGHGGPKGWAQERVLKVNDILGWDNYYKMPLIITATCSFTGYDDPGLVSAGEYALLNDKGGAIALMTTVRAVYSLENERLTAAVFDTIFSNDNGTNLTIGQIIQRAKNNNWQDTTRINARKFALIGDPSMVLSIPNHSILTTHINGKSITEVIDTIKALQKVSISGIITDNNGKKLENYSGTIFPTIFDKKTKLVTLRNDSRSRVEDFELHKSVLFKGAASIRNGQFSFEFIVPKDIDYRYGQGRISYYGLENGNESDAAGNFSSFIVGGTDTTILSDVNGPDISLFMNNENFVHGGITADDPILLVKLYDENGINVTGNSIGHDLIAILDGNDKNSFLLNEFYESEVDDYKNGEVRFPLNDLSPGTHSIKVRAWDIANNSSETMLEFNVASSEDSKIKNIYNYPNPFSTSTEFMFEHTLKGAELGVNIYIFSLSGKLVKTIQEEVASDGFRVNQVFWDGRDDFGDKLGKGIYLYKIKVADREFNVSMESDFQKLVIIH